MNKVYYFIGIGGIGMSSLVRYLLSRGEVVGGYDRERSELCMELEAEGAEITYDSADTSFLERFQSSAEVVYTAAVTDSNPQLAKAKSLGIKSTKRAQFLAEVVSTGKVLAVAGTHGKTSTATFLTHFFMHAGAAFTSFLGGISTALNSNYYSSGSDFFIVEADEFDRSFLHLHPDAAIVTSVEPDHLDIYENPQQVITAFQQFLSQTTGPLIVHESLKGLSNSAVSYGVETASTVQISGVEVLSDVTRFILKDASGALSVQVPVFGLHNLLNVTAAFTLSCLYFDRKVLVGAFDTVPLPKRRATLVRTTATKVFYDDYAHHPSEIRAMHQLLSSRYQDKAITGIFQPHLFSRTRDFLDEFRSALKLFDRLIVLPIYPARELPIAGIESSLLLKGHQNAVLVEKQELLDVLAADTSAVIVTMGAGDIAGLVPLIDKLLLR